MNSSVNSFSESSNSAAFNQAQTSEQVTNIEPETKSIAEPDLNQGLNRQQPIPPPSEPMQYRAIGLVCGRYLASAEQFTQGNLVATDGTEINTVLLGRIVSLVRNHLDLTQEHLWVVYPRVRQEDGNLHLQIVGVWEPENLAKPQAALNVADAEDSSTEIENPTLEVEDGYFSVRGEIVYQSIPDKQFVVKIKQAPRKESDKPKYFKLQIKGDLGTKAVGQFWDLHVQRQNNSLMLSEGKAIAMLPSKPKLKKNKPPRGTYSAPPKRDYDTPRPLRKADNSSSSAGSPVPKPMRKAPTPKPVKRPKPLQ